jgi:hypothetical protein
MRAVVRDGPPFGAGGSGGISRSTASTLSPSVTAARYGNDWLIVPHPVRVGTLSRPHRLRVRTNFGEELDIAPHRSAGAPVLCETSIASSITPSHAIFVPPAILGACESAPIEEVRLLRDETTNLLFAIEHTVCDAMRRARPGHEVANEVRRFRAGGDAATVPEGDLRTTLALWHGAPEYWIPFVPVRVASSDRAILYRRAKTQSAILPNGARHPIAPRGVLLTPTSGPYDIHEEEVDRSGARVTRTVQRVRWHDGRVVTWVGRTRTHGLGEGRSGLRYDVLVGDV